MTPTKPQHSQVPVVGTTIRIKPEDIALSDDGVRFVCRILYDQETNQWIIASRWDTAIKKWVPVTKHRRIGMFVFLNDKPTAADQVVRISAIQPTGRGAFGDPAPTFTV
jgi:hypothetical protein